MHKPQPDKTQEKKEQKESRAPSLGSDASPGSMNVGFAGDLWAGEETLPGIVVWVIYKAGDGKGPKLVCGAFPPSGMIQHGPRRTFGNTLCRPQQPCLPRCWPFGTRPSGIHRPAALGILETPDLQFRNQASEDSLIDVNKKR